MIQQAAKLGMTAWREIIANGRRKLNSQHHVWLGKFCLLVPPELAAPSPLLPCATAASPDTAASPCHQPPGPSIRWDCTCKSLPKAPQCCSVGQSEPPSWGWPQNAQLSHFRVCLLAVLLLAGAVCVFPALACPKPRTVSKRIGTKQATVASKQCEL